MEIREKIEKIISKALPNAEVHILDPRKDGKHLEAIVISDHFAKMPLVKRHQVVMQPLKELFENGLHALALKTFTPLEWEQEEIDV